MRHVTSDALCESVLGGRLWVRGRREASNLNAGTTWRYTSMLGQILQHRLVGIVCTTKQLVMEAFVLANSDVGTRIHGCRIVNEVWFVRHRISLTHTAQRTRGD